VVVHLGEVAQELVDLVDLVEEAQLVDLLVLRQDHPSQVQLEQLLLLGGGTPAVLGEELQHMVVAVEEELVLLEVMEMDQIQEMQEMVVLVCNSHPHLEIQHLL
jgi:hypothetical protein